ncbi:MAG: hypothetical protein JO061_03320 [Acidobacteriaceae bacterium]|nr:hypothetical protein [Acidobacteriaceae bacterium]
MPPLAYFLTFSTYGTHLPGSEKGWVDARHRLPGSPLLTRNAQREKYWRIQLNEFPCTFDQEARIRVLEAILSVCFYRRWVTHAIHVRSMHVHAVLCGEARPERMIIDLKAYATRSLRSGAVGPNQRSRYWTRHGSTRYLWNEVSLLAAIDYVLNGQGARMSCYPNHPQNENPPVLGSLTLPRSVSTPQ